MILYLCQLVVTSRATRWEIIIQSTTYDTISYFYDIDWREGKQAKVGRVVVVVVVFPVLLLLVAMLLVVSFLPAMLPFPAYLISYTVP